MKKRLNSTTHKMRRESAKFQREKTPEQRIKLSKVVTSKKGEMKELLQLEENKENTLLTDVFDVLEKSWFGEHSPMHMENYLGNTMNILFWYGSQETAKNNYENIVDLLKDMQDLELVNEDDNSASFKTKSRSNIKISHKDWDTSVSLYWTFNGKAIEKAKKEYRRFANSKNRNEEQEAKRYEKEYRERYDKR